MTAFAEIATRPSREGWVCDLPATLDDALERMLVATREAIRLATVGYRFTRRFGWTTRWQERHVERLDDRRKTAIRIADYADWELAPLWDHWSRALPPLIELGAVCAACPIIPAGSGEINVHPLPYSGPPRLC